MALKELLDKEWNWMRVLYTTEATAHGGRDGHVRSSDGILDLDLRVPVELADRARTALARVGQMHTNLVSAAGKRDGANQTEYQ